MSVYHRSTAKSRILQEYRNREEEIATALSSNTDKRMRREIANSNERRRMQSINAGFQLLRSLIPHSDGEKLSKAAILQQATDHIRGLEQDKAKMLAQNSSLRRLLSEVSARCNVDVDYDLSLYGGSPPPAKRKKRDTESSDEGISADMEDFRYEDVRRELLEVRAQLNRERQLRLILEGRARALDTAAHKVLHVGEHIEHHIKIHHSDHASPSLGHHTPEHHPETSYVEEVKKDLEPVMSYAPLPLKLETDSDHRVPSSPPLKTDRLDAAAAPGDQTASSMSRRNLETIVEAIRHLEGDEISREQKFIANPHAHTATGHPHSAHTHPTSAFHQPLIVSHFSESEKDSSITSDQEDLRSESSGRDSPSPRYVSLQNVQHMQHPARVASPKQSATKVVVTNTSYSDRYPAVTNVLQGNVSQPHVFYRPGVIVHKS